MSDLYQTAIFMIEGGRALEMVKEHIAEVMRVRTEVNALADELGVERILTRRDTGVLLGVVFKNVVHPDFKKPRSKDGASFPKKRTEWFDKFEAQKGHADPSRSIANAFGIPGGIVYKTEHGEGWHCVGRPFENCGFLYLSEDGPYAMWVPDVPAAVAKDIAQGHTVDEPAASFKLEFEGCRRIKDEEWQILVLQHKLAKEKQ